MADARTTLVDELGKALDASRKRRDFIKIAALGGIGVLVPSFFTACSSDPTNPSEHSNISFGSPAGALNLLYATVQLQNDFYSRVISSKYIDMTNAESSLISTNNTAKSQMVTAISTMLTAGRISDAVLFNFRSVDFSLRSSVLTVAQSIEEAGVAAANWAVARAKTAEAAVQTAKMASVLSRNATTIRHLIDMNNLTSRPLFGAGVTAGLDATQDANAWYAATKVYFRTTFSIGGF